MNSKVSWRQLRYPALVIVGSLALLGILSIVHDHYYPNPGDHTWSVFWAHWGAQLGVAFTVLLAAAVALLPSHLEREVQGLAERIQSPLSSFDQVVAKATALLQELGDRPNTVFKFVSACPVLGLELGDNSRNRWRSLLVSRIEAGCETEIVCLDPGSSAASPLSPLGAFCKALAESHLNQPDRSHELYDHARRQIEFFQSNYCDTANLTFRLGAEPPFQIIISRNEQGHHKAILYFSSAASLSGNLPAWGFATEDDRMAKVLESLFQYVSEAAIDASQDPRSSLQKERDSELLILRNKRNQGIELAFDQITPGFKLIVKPEVFPPDIALARNSFVDAIGKGVELVWKNTPPEQRYGVDIGTGTGILALMLAKHAPKVLATDIGTAEIANARANVERYKATVKSPADIQVVHSDLFESVAIPSVAKPLIVFNHPYYPSPSNVFNVGGLKAGIHLIEPFLKDAKTYIENGGGVIMPYSEIADQHNPLFVAIRLKYKPAQLELQEDEKYGKHYIYLFTL